MSHVDEDKAKLRNVIKRAEGKLPRKSVFFVHGNVQHAGTETKRNYGLKHHLHLILEDVYLMGAAALGFGISMQRNVWNKHDVFLDDVDKLICLTN